METGQGVASLSSSPTFAFSHQLLFWSTVYLFVFPAFVWTADFLCKLKETRSLCKKKKEKEFPFQGV